MGEMVGTCSTHGEWEMRLKFQLENPYGIVYLGDLGVNGRII
jgi:hypothetical protein